MDKSSLLYYFLRILLITVGVYLAFRYLLPLTAPFLLAYLFIRMLYPAMCFLHEKWKLPRFLSHYGTLFFVLGGIFGICLFILQKLLVQLRLFFSNFPVYRQLLGASFYRQTQRICHCIDYYFNLDDGTVYNFCEKQLQNLESESTTLLTGKAGKTLMQCISGSLHFFMLLVIITISMIILVKELKPLHKSYQNSTFFPVVHRILVRLKESGLTYLKAEGIILLSNWLVCSLGLFLIHNPYFFLLGLGIAVFDAFPVLGSGLIFIPWGIYHFFDQNYYYAAILITTYLITLFTRELLEAKLIGRGLGLNPFIMTAAIFIGIELFGVCGIFLGPLAIVLIQAILSVTDASPAKINKTE